TIRNYRLPEVLARLPDIPTIIIDSSPTPLTGVGDLFTQQIVYYYGGHSRTLGWARDFGRKMAFKHFRGWRYMLHADDDAVLDSSVIDKLKKTFALDSKIGIVGTCGKKHREEAERMGKMIRYVTHVWTAGMLVKREVAKQICFDKNLHYFEDLDYCIRAWLKGFRVVENAEACIEHPAHVWSSEEILEAGLYILRKLKPKYRKLFRLTTREDWVYNFITEEQQLKKKGGASASGI
ncbi:MAG: glycosyltransferase, partial [Candidatus Caldarchaeum sp.]